jgi:hypothetical protein
MLPFLVEPLFHVCLQLSCMPLGSLTILDGKPVIMYDCYNVADCLPPNASSPGLGDNPFVRHRPT